MIPNFKATSQLAKKDKIKINIKYSYHFTGTSKRSLNRDFVETRLQCFFVKFANFWRASFLENTSGRLLNLYPVNIIDNQIKMFLYEQYVKENTYSMSVSVHFKCNQKKVKQICCIINLIHLNLRTLKSLQSFIVYQFTSVGCTSYFIDETKRHLKKRTWVKITDWLHFSKHLQRICQCWTKVNLDCFEISICISSYFR